ncbi:MAG TPA: polysaccharide deacetylase family protein, partial [Candidatus Limnocylindrales bacterium]|nr:polysaccharide deacetylase family protein [Candidatus Limnocylindrales bacterium]
MAGSRFRVALTFDAEHPDRPSAPGVQERLLDLLARDAVASTFFIQGRWAEAYPATARRIAEDGHLIGNHSHYHARMPLLNARGLRADVADAEAAIIDATGIDPQPWFRCPFGAGSANERVQRIIRAAGYRHVGWHVAGIDWPVERSGRDVEDQILAGCLAHGDGAVVLLHTWPDRTEAAIPGVVRRLRDAGAELVRIDALESALLPDREVTGTLFVPP